MKRCTEIALLALLTLALPVGAVNYDNNTIHDQFQGLPTVYVLRAGAFMDNASRTLQDHLWRIPAYKSPGPENSQSYWFIAPVTHVDLVPARSNVVPAVIAALGYVDHVAYSILNGGEADNVSPNIEGATFIPFLVAGYDSMAVRVVEEATNGTINSGSYTETAPYTGELGATVWVRGTAASGGSAGSAESATMALTHYSLLPTDAFVAAGGSIDYPTPITNTAIHTFDVSAVRWVQIHVTDLHSAYTHVNVNLNKNHAVPGEPRRE